MKTSRKMLAIAVSGMVIGGLMAFTLGGDEWKVPDANQKTVNPVKADKESLGVGGELWAKYCKSCHGKYGEGDGTKASELKTELVDFTTAEFQKQSDGSLFYKVEKGRDEMPSFSKKIPDEEDVWSIINYMRTFKSK